MIPQSQIQQLEESLFLAIKNQDSNAVQRFVAILSDQEERSSLDILKSIENLSQQMIFLQKEMNMRFESIQREMNTRFESMQKEMNTRFESMQKEMNARFESVDKRFESVDKRFNQLTWLIGLMFVAISVIMTVFKFVK
jgi:DNA anti-recombination protein RmuC